MVVIGEGNGKWVVKKWGVRGKGKRWVVGEW